MAGRILWRAARRDGSVTLQGMTGPFVVLLPQKYGYLAAATVWK
jgi:hypothetical protein